MTPARHTAIFNSVQLVNIRTLLHERWGDAIGGDEDFKISAALVDGQVTVGLVLEGPRERYLSEASLPPEPAGLTGESAALLLLDLLEGYVADYLDGDRRNTLPLDWSTLEYQGHQVQIRVDVTRPALEAAASALLEDEG